MKVFISWSGERSKKIAETLKEWIKCVIQSAEPFVSSEDIQKGARWSNDISKELQDSNFGILCVTKDNFEAPWLLFEAGALSKTLDKALVVPFLFELNPSELQNSPLLQFQATLFSKEEMYKTMNTMNNVIEKKLQNLEKIFEKWYPELEENLNEILSSNIYDNTPSENKPSILEEILSLSRDNQKLLKSSESHTAKELERVVEKLERISAQSERNVSYRLRAKSALFLEAERIIKEKEVADIGDYDFLLLISNFKDDYPWLYDAGKNLVRGRNSSVFSDEEKFNDIENFQNLLDTVYIKIKQ